MFYSSDSKHCPAAACCTTAVGFGCGREPLPCDGRRLEAAVQTAADVAKFRAPLSLPAAAAGERSAAAAGTAGHAESATIPFPGCTAAAGRPAWSAAGSRVVGAE